MKFLFFSSFEKNINSMSEFITIKEAAKLVKKHESSIYRWAKKLPKNQVKNDRPFLVSKKVLFAQYNTQEKTQKQTQKTQKRKTEHNLDKHLIINNLEDPNESNFAFLHANSHAKTNAKLNSNDKDFYQAQIKEQNAIIQELQNTNHNLLLLVGAKEEQVNNLLEKVNLISSKFDEQESEVIEILAQYSKDIEKVKQAIKKQRTTSEAQNSEFIIIYFVGAVALSISLILVVLFFN